MIYQLATHGDLKWGAGSNQPDKRDFVMAKRLGKRVASIAKSLRG
ncbi:hypothetical protein [Alteribacter populi]|nr:hypothetical protein [Alteribacter populi]